MGEPKVLKALLGKQIEATEITLNGFEVRRQARPHIGYVNEAIRKEWDKKGKSYPGAYGLVRKEGAKAVVGCVEFSSREAVKEAVARLDFWNYHDRKNKSDEWFKYQAFQEGETVYITELLIAPESELEPVDENYKEDPKYKDGVDEMARQAYEWRLSQEGKPPRKELA